MYIAYRFYAFLLFVLSVSGFAVPALGDVPAHYPDYYDNPLLTNPMRIKIAPHVIPLDHPIKETLDYIFSQSRVQENVATVIDAGFQVIVPPEPHSYLLVARHPAIPGFVFKMPLDSESRSRNDLPHWVWLSRRCTEAKKIKKIIQENNIRYFSVPDKWLYILPAYPYSSSLTPQPMILVETDMELARSEETEWMWKKGIKRKHLDELYSIVKHGYGGRSVLHLDRNVPFTIHGKFAFIDTEGPQSKVNLKSIRKFLSKEMAEYWETLIR